MKITEDTVDGSFTIKINEEEHVTAKARVSIYDEPMIVLQYSFLGDVILTEQVTEKWWWKLTAWSVGIEVEQFLAAGKAKAAKLRIANKAVEAFREQAKDVFRNE